MIVTVEPVILQLPNLTQPRSSGIHVSSIIRCIAIEGNILKREDVEEISLVDSRIITDPDAVLRIWIGCAWEDFYLPRIPGVVAHAQEYKYDGVYLSPDGESVTVFIRPTKGLALIIHEVKATYKSVKTVGNLIECPDPSKNWMWIAQLKSYCLAAGTTYAWLHVLFLCGNYRFPIKPQIRIFKIQFEQWELEENWTLMKDYVFYRTEDPYLIGGV